jgi:16S rRNA (adenine1518-N6/adenine1519-N6)-dimethyltransferase
MIQREVARRICAKPGTPEYGAFTVYANYHSEPGILFDVPPECFMPRPKVCSSVIFMKTREKKLLPPEDEKLFFRIVRAAFGQRRKTLANSLSAALKGDWGKDELTRLIKSCGFNEKVRGEMLSIEDFTRLLTFLR